MNNAIHLKAAAAFDSAHVYSASVKVDVVTREVELLLAGKGIVMKSPDGTRYRIAVANGGALSVTAV